MAKKLEDLSALRAKVQTYETELKQTGKEFEKSMTGWMQRFKERPPTLRSVGELMEVMARHIDFMEKYEAALRDLVASLERHVKALEKKVPKFNVGLER